MTHNDAFAFSMTIFTGLIALGLLISAGACCIADAIREKNRE